MGTGGWVGVGVLEDAWGLRQKPCMDWVPPHTPPRLFIYLF